MKECSRCKNKKTTECFSKMSSASDGLQAYCKQCVREYNRNSYIPVVKAEHPEGMSKCSRCTNILPESNFYKRKNGVSGYCKSCTKEYNKKYRNKHLPSHLKSSSAGYKVCRKCFEELPHDKFTKNKKLSDGLSSYCVPCQRSFHKYRMQNDEKYRKRYYKRRSEYRKKRRREDPEYDTKLKAQKRQQKIKHKLTYKCQKINSRGGDYKLSKQELQELIDKYDGLCVLCGVNEYEDIDHIEPVVAGGNSHPNNLQPLCKPCHNIKTHLLGSVDLRI